MGKPHAVLVPTPAQGHVIPMMRLAYRLIDYGFKVTFVNTEFNHKLMLQSADDNNEIRMISMPDGLGPEEDRHDIAKLVISNFHAMPPKLEEVIRKINADDDDDVVTCVIADKIMAWAFDVAKKMGIRRAGFYPPAATNLAQALVIPKLIEDGMIDHERTPIKNQIIQLSPNMPAINTEKLPWNCMGDSMTNKIFFQSAYKTAQVVESVDWMLCNSALELENATFTLFPKLIPIGPVLATSQLGRSYGQFWPEDSTCLNWLDQQPAQSVVYVAFGSFTIFEQIQFQELAYGLEQSGKRFLWVIRPDPSTTVPYPVGFQTRVSSRGLIIGWAPQESVLSHPSVACFFTHCGWNSAIESVNNGVPLLCWPYFADQYLNQDYVCDIWEVGLRLNKDENGIITRKEIDEKLNLVFDNEVLKTRILKLMKTTRKTLADGGSSSNNFKEFVKELMI